MILNTGSLSKEEVFLMNIKKKLLAAVLSAAMLSTQALETTAWAAESGQEIALADMTEEEVLQAALSEIHIPQIVTGNLTLQEKSENGAAFQWTSSNESVISTTAESCAVYYDEVDTPAGVVTRQAQDTSVTLTLKASYGSAETTKTYQVTVKAKKPQEEYVGYLYAHFNEHAGTTYDGIQQIFFGISKNGVDWTALNNN